MHKLLIPMSRMVWARAEALVNRLVRMTEEDGSYEFYLEEEIKKVVWATILGDISIGCSYSITTTLIKITYPCVLFLFKLFIS